MTARNAFTEEEKKRIVDLYIQGVEVRYITQAFGCCDSSIRKWVKAAGVPTRPSWRETKRNRRVV